MRPRRVTLALVPLLAVALATASAAAPTTKPQLVDPKGDALGGNAGTDAVSVLYTTTGIGSGKSYVPRRLRVTLTLAGAVLSNPGVSYEVEATTDRCGLVTFTYSPGTVYGNATGRTGWAIWEKCGESEGSPGVELLAPAVSGNTIVWEFGIKSTPLKVGTVFRDFTVRVEPTNPVVPYPSRGDFGYTGTGLIDSGKGTGTWKLG